MVVIELEDVYKKFRRGELYDSLRDLIPALTGRLLRGSGNLAEEQEFWALQNVSMEVHAGEAVAIIGHNGAGKSTILKLLSRVMPPTRGSVRVRGRLSALIEIGAGFHPDLTGRENVYLNGSILGMSREEIRAKFDDIVDFAGLKDFIDTPVKRYSSGMYARLGFSVAVHVDPEILVVDEVLSVGDYVFQTRCIERMRSIRESGATILFVSHNLQAASELCPRAVLLGHGQIIAEGETNDVVQTYLKLSQGDRDGGEKKKARVTQATLHDHNGPQVNFVAGARAWLEIEFEATAKLDNVSVGIEVRDEANYRIFNTSTERLGMENWTLGPGEVRRVCIELVMHLARGTFHVGVHVFRSDIPLIYDSWVPCTTFFVNTLQDVRGAVNLYPKISDGSPAGDVAGSLTASRLL